jgi:nitrogen regulatory protein PII
MVPKEKGVLLMSFSDADAKKIIKNFESSYKTKRIGDRLKIFDIDGKTVGTIKGPVTETKIRRIMGFNKGGRVRLF